MIQNYEKKKQKRQAPSQQLLKYKNTLNSIQASIATLVTVLHAGAASSYISSSDLASH
jgi:hypothetical protein